MAQDKTVPNRKPAFGSVDSRPVFALSETAWLPRSYQWSWLLPGGTLGKGNVDTILCARRCILCYFIARRAFLGDVCVDCSTFLFVNSMRTNFNPALFTSSADLDLDGTFLTYHLPLTTANSASLTLHGTALLIRQHSTANSRGNLIGALLWRSSSSSSPSTWASMLSRPLSSLHAWMSRILVRYDDTSLKVSGKQGWVPEVLANWTSAEFSSHCRLFSGFLVRCELRPQQDLVAGVAM